MELEKSLNDLSKLLEARKGGRGSGNWGHEGIPGRRGGSARTNVTGDTNSSGDITALNKIPIAKNAVSKFNEYDKKFYKAGPGIAGEFMDRVSHNHKYSGDKEISLQSVEQAIASTKNFAKLIGRTID